MNIKIHEAVDLLLGEIEPPASEVREVKDKVRKRIVYALVKGHLRHANAGQEGLDRNELLVWAKRKWPGKIKEPVVHFVAISETLNLIDSAGAETYPSTIDACHDLLRAARKMIRNLDIRNMVLMGEVARLRPMAEKYEAICEANRQSASMPRKTGE